MTLSVVALSDTHGMHAQVKVPDADVLIHSGDFCKYGKVPEVKDFAAWLKTLPHTHKIITAGNHDKPIEKNPVRAREIFAEAGVTLLLNEGIIIEGVKFWASPITPTFFEWSFMKNRGPKIDEVWQQIPNDVDVLITHGPAYGHGDLAPAYRTAHPKVAGCLDLLNRIREIRRVSHGYHPRVHVCGHIHDGHGVTASDEFPGLSFINAAICTEQYQPTNSPIGFAVSKLEKP